MQPCNRIYYSKISYFKNNKFYYKLHLAGIFFFLLIYTTMHGSMNIKFLNAKQVIVIYAYINFGIVNSSTRFHLVGYFY